MNGYKLIGKLLKVNATFPEEGLFSLFAKSSDYK